MRLGQVGYLRFQKFVEIIYTPVVSADAPGDPAVAAVGVSDGEPPAQDFDFYPQVEAEITVTGVDASPVSAEPAGAEDDPLFEDAYRSAFMNYEEGRRFRLKDKPSQQAALARAGAPAPAPADLAAADFLAASTPVYRVVVKTKGIYRLTWSYLLDPATGVASGLAGTLPSAFKLTNLGVEVPIRVVDGGDGTFGPGDYIEFYGEGLLDEPKLLLNYHYDPNTMPGFLDISQANDFTDENVYYLLGESGTRARIPAISGTVQGAFTTFTSFTDTAHREFDDKFVPDGLNDPFYQGPPLLSNNGTLSTDPNAPNCGYSNPGINTSPSRNWLGPVLASDPNHYCQACSLALPDPVNTAGTAAIRVRMRGSTSEAVTPDHMTVVQLGTVASQSGTMCWDGETVVTQALSVPQSAVATGAGVYIEMPGLSATASFEAFFLDWIEVDYLRSLRLNANRLLARFPTNVSRTYDMGGFPNGTAGEIVAYDLSQTLPSTSIASPRLITGGTITPNGGTFNYKFSLALDPTLPAGAQRRFAAAGTGGFLSPVRTELVGGEDLRQPTLSADMIVLSTPDVVDTTPGSVFMSYLSHRESDSGLTVKLVMMRDVYDSFSAGLETPEAIRAFLSYAVTTWRGVSGTAAPPAYVMLVGDGVIDYKNVLAEAGWVDQVPTFIMYQPNPVLDYYASDTFIAAFMGADQLPDIHLGRVPVRSHAESESLFQKLMDYDLSPPTGAWRSRGLFLADKGHDAGETGTFESEQDRVAGTFYVAPFTNQKIYAADPNFLTGGNVDQAKWQAEFKNMADAGAAMTSFFGHGNFFAWGLQTLIQSDQVLSLLAATDKPSFVVNENCLAGGFHARLADSLGEAFLKAPGRGAIAVFAPAGLSFATVSTPINDAINNDLFGLRKERRFGNLMTDVKVAMSFFVTDMQAYVLLGDPAQRVILPGPRPPRDFQATTGLDAHVLLTWNPSPDAGVKTRIYRAEVPNGTYSLLNPAGAAGTSYDDTTVIDGKAYFYRAVSLDPNGVFEGGVTNLNTDCNFFDPPASGPGCVWAVPLNPNPPSIPADFRVVNPGLGDRLQVAWSTAVENDIANYTLRFGTTSGGPYPSTLNIPAPASGGEATGLVTGTTYYFVMTATNTSGRTSGSTPEVSGTPFVFDGVTPPDFITDLQVLRSAGQPSSIELRWTPPTIDIYGSPTTLNALKIYRGTVPSFVPSPSNLIATVGGGTSVHTDPNAWIAPGNFFYLVGASDRNGFLSGLGRQLPSGISDLTVTLNAPNLSLTWPAVTLDVDGVPTMVDHYVVYSDTQPVSRPRTDVIAPLAASVTSTSFTTPTPAGTIVYYSVIVVDVRGNKSPF